MARLPTSTRLLLTRPPGAAAHTLAEYEAAGGYAGLRRALATLSPEQVLAEIEASGLRGRGGASFPTARKWRLAANRPAGTKHVVGNGGEHEPGSEKDRFLIARYPHAVLEGILLCCYATGATRGWLYVIEDMAEPIATAERALAELRAAHLLGADVLGRGFACDVTLHRAPTTYVAGEETAALASIEGRPAKPRKKPPYPGEAGLFGQPTTVNNVETLALAAWILREGAAKFRAIGKGSSAGTMLFTLPALAVRPGVVEVPFGTTWRELIYGLGGGPKSGRPLRAILPALSCAFLSADHLDASIDHDTLKALGTTPGCGGLSWIEDGDDALARVLEIARFFMAEQCGQCAPCRMETNQFVHVLAGVQAGKSGDWRGNLEKVAAFSRGKGWCSLIEMAAAPVLSAARLFEKEFAARAGS